MINIIVESNDLQNIIDNLFSGNLEDEFIDLLEHMNKRSIKIVLVENNELGILYQKIYQNKKYKRNSDISFINIMLEKFCMTISDTEFNSITQNMHQYVYLDDFSTIFAPSSGFNPLINYGLYKDTVNQNYFLIKNIKEYLQLGCIKSLNSNNPEELIDCMEVYTRNLIFDKDIVDTLYRLSDSFNDRLKEIIYHLYVIETEIPELLSQGLRSYDQIGSALSVACTPERNRETVRNQLTATLNFQDLNCELHTKLRKISSNPPDRIYFCPSIPNTICNERAGKSYIYKITSHV